MIGRISRRILPHDGSYKMNKSDAGGLWRALGILLTTFTTVAAVTPVRISRVCRIEALSEAGQPQCMIVWGQPGRANASAAVNRKTRRQPMRMHWDLLRTYTIEYRAAGRRAGIDHK